MSEKKCILVVDDEPDVVTYLCSLLEDNGYDTLKAYDGKEGMALTRQHSPDLICLDITMPEETGVRMMRNLHDDPETTSIPVVLVTGVDPQFKDFIEHRKQVNPPAAYFEKPVDRDILLETVNKILS